MRMRKSLLVKRLQKLKKLHGFACLALCEPLIDASNLERVRGQLGFQYAFSNIKGRIWVLFEGGLGCVFGRSI